MLTYTSEVTETEKEPLQTEWRKCLIELCLTLMVILTDQFLFIYLLS